ncbi:hypothetical protein C1646_750799 [Rhizophagus diaphanus]|nr:hypothetical protein C1646_750799 [Rhizophagus diaphanus] [Rhizophagus sp. MUCL 43196]
MYTLRKRSRRIGDHIWICEANEFTIREVILSAMVSYKEKMLEKGDIDQAAMVLLRGVYNSRFNKIANDKKGDFQLMGLLLRGIEKTTLDKKVREGNQFRKEGGIGKVDKRSRNDILERVNNENKKQKKKRR